MSRHERVAIVGIGGIFPRSPDLASFWANIKAGVAATREVPPGRWLLDPADAYDPRVGWSDHVYSTRGCFVEGFALDSTGLDLDPDLIDRLDPMFALALHAGKSAWLDAKMDQVDRSRVGVVFGNIVLPTETASAIARDTLGRTFDESQGFPSDASESFEPLNTRVAGLPAGLLAEALGLGGGAYTIDAACASSLYALKLASDELLEGRADAMLTGGLSRPDPLYTQMGFSQLRALSPSGVASPFGEAADGLVVGEGSGIFVLKRLSDAIEAGDRIYAVIAGIGLSNDVDGGLLAPHSEGQLRAMRAAYKAAGWEPRDVDLIECHATGTPVGDAVEFASLRTLWGESGQTPGGCVIGSVKSNVGHALTAAGAAGLLKVLLALQNETLPPTAGFSSTSPTLDLANSPFRILAKSEPWPRRTDDQPRRIALSGFGFGGINAHVLIEEWLGSSGSIETTVTVPEPIAIVGLAAHFGPFVGLRAVQERLLGGLKQPEPSEPKAWWGAESSDWFASEGHAGRDWSGFRIDEFRLPTDRFRIPPKELEEMLPQQSLFLSLASQAILDAGWDDRTRLRAGCLVGLGLDLNTTNFHVRWSLLDKARDWNQRFDLGLSDEDLDAWVSELRDAFGPALSANRTMGALGSIVASRVAREFRLGGPSFTVSSEETSAYRAVDVAVGMLRRRELDEAVVGAVDLPGDLRASLAEVKLRHDDIAETGLTDGAAVLILKRLSDAERDGDKIYGVIQGVGWKSGMGLGSLHSLGRALADARLNPDFGLLDSDYSGLAGYHHAADTNLDNAGAVSGMVRLVRSILALHQQILPPLVNEGAILEHQYWLRDRLDGPRHAIAGGSGVDWTSAHIVLESYEPHSADQTLDRIQPTGPLPAALFAIEADDESELLRGLAELEAQATGWEQPIEEHARDWLVDHPADPARKLAVALVASSLEQLFEAVGQARQRVQSGSEPSRARASDRVAYSPRPLGPNGKVAFVFPGMGNHFAGMGRELGVHWPEILRREDAENRLLRSQMASGTYWNSDPPESFDDHRESIFGQVSLGIFVSELLTLMGLKADSAIGYSLGETTALFSLGAWTDRDEMFRRFDASPLFRSDLAGPCDAARSFWNLGSDEAVDWVAGILQRPASTVLEALKEIDRAYLLIVNTDAQVVVGGQKSAVAKLVERVGGRFHPLPLVSTVHCEVVHAVEREYRELHLLPTAPPHGVKFYSGSTGESYPVDRESAADSILAHALHGVDFPGVIRQAYADGVRAFIEVGPGASCTRMIGEILQGQPHLEASACPGEREPVAAFLAVLARLIAERIPVDLSAIHGRGQTQQVERDSSRHLQIQVGGPSFSPVEWAPPTIEESSGMRSAMVGEAHPTMIDHDTTPRFMSKTMTSTLADPLLSQLQASDSARGFAHEAFLRNSSGLGDLFARQLGFQMELIDRLSRGDFVHEIPLMVDSSPRPALDREQCLTFAVGRIGDVLGPEFAEIDSYPTRVRLPDEPLMLVDRIMTIEGEPRSMTTGRVVTEHDVLPDLWYLDAGRIPTCIAVEAGQADLFLSAYLGIDFETKGLAVYRLLDAIVTFHDELPTVGQVIHYDIQIDGFFRQGDSRLFRFRFEATVDGRPLMSMTQGCAGFFTKEALDAGQGVVKTALDLREVTGIKPENWSPLVPMAVESMDDSQVEALRHGDLVAAFGPAFEGLNLHQSTRLPGGLMRLVDRVPLIDPAGGRFGLGLIRGEADIRPEDWYMTCHFVDDRVMPGTLMYECCLHTLRIFLARMGWIGEEGEVACQPVPGVASKLKCRGQVIESTKVVTYEVSLKEIGYRTEPYVIVDALMFADGKPIVEITDMSLRMTGLDRDKLERIWAKSSRPALYDTSKILAFAIGKPSEAFGEPYRIFDDGRIIARLPGPPYQFLDRVVEVAGEPWKMVTGAKAVAEYDVPPDEWYFDADRQEVMPFAVLLETALQPCGWLAAYVGSALTSDVDLSFRNLGGSAVQHIPVGREIGTLITTATLTKVSKSGGMIIQQYDFTMTDGSTVVYDGETTFGFFSKQALANQVGIGGAILWDEPGASRGESFDFPDVSPFPDDHWGMIDRVEEYHPTGGPNGLGFIKGTKTVDPTEWFFEAHFFQDPVCPGSLGLESFQQLLKVVAWKRWGLTSGTAFESLGLGDLHRWTYRGQILPTDRLVTVRAVVTAVDDDAQWLKADGFLDVDGRVIYQMNDFTLKAGRAGR